jgi:hypothetical protein
MNLMEKNPLAALAERVAQPSGMISEAANRHKANSARQIAFVGELIQFAYNFLIFVLSLFSIPAEVFLRYNFGQRYLTFGKMILGYFLILVYWNITSLGSVFSSGNSILLGLVSNGFLYGYLIACVAHFLIVQRRSFRGIRCYSKYAGDSLPFWRKLPFYEAIGGQYNVQLYLEPLLLFLLSIITGPLLPGMGTFLFMCSISLFLKGYTQHAAFRQRIMDITDQQIEAEQVSQAVTRWQDPAGLKTEGYVMPSYMARYSESSQQGNPAERAAAVAKAAGPVWRAINGFIDGMFEDDPEEEEKKPPADVSTSVVGGDPPQAGA